MTLKTIKISEANYKWLSILAGDIQTSAGRPVSLDETLSRLRTKKLGELAGSWKMSDKEAADMEKKLSEGWHRWKTVSV